MGADWGHDPRNAGHPPPELGGEPAQGASINEGNDVELPPAPPGLPGITDLLTSVLSPAGPVGPVGPAGPTGHPGPSLPDLPPPVPPDPPADPTDPAAIAVFQQRMAEYNLLMEAHDAILRQKVEATIDMARRMRD